jgi:hypothetical protein
MSANNQSLLIKHKGKYLAFPDVMAESWSNFNELDTSEAKEFTDFYKAFYWLSLQDTEYGISCRLIKDGRKVKIISSS